MCFILWSISWWELQLGQLLFFVYFSLFFHRIVNMHFSFFISHLQKDFIRCHQRLQLLALSYWINLSFHHQNIAIFKVRFECMMYNGLPSWFHNEWQLLSAYTSKETYLLNINYQCLLLWKGERWWCLGRNNKSWVWIFTWSHNRIKIFLK